MAKIDKIALRQKIQELQIDNELKSELLAAVNEQKTFGLVWEDKPEEALDVLKENIPIFKEDESKRIVSENSDAPNHIIIEGDNLHALTSLCYSHEGKIDVIYIDPPYNTGNNDFVYNDKFIDKEDGYRHSKWLSFMDKRLRIAKKLLSDKGVIFISIDDNEQANLKLLCDEVFGESAFYTSFAWINSQKESLEEDTKFAGANLGKIKKSFEYVLVYSKSSYSINPDSGTSKYIDKLITNGSNSISTCIIPKGVNCIEPITKTIYGRVGGDNDYYIIKNPEGMIIVSGVLQNNIVIEGPLRNANTLTRFFWGETVIDHKGQRLESVYLSKTGMLNTRKLRAGNTPSTVLVGKGTAKNGTLLLKEIFGKSPFNFSKPVELVKYLISKQRDTANIILDFFAGSGTTLHATMQLNSEDGGHRQCILVTNNENNICEEVTYERNKRVINGYTKPNGDFVEGLHNNNLRYFKTDFVKREMSSKKRHELMDACVDILRIKEDIYDEVSEFGGKRFKKSVLRYFVQDERQMLVILDERAVGLVSKMLKDIVSKECRMKVFVYSDGQYAYQDEFKDVLPYIDLCAFPDSFLQALHNILPPPAYPEDKLTNMSDIEIEDAISDTYNYNEEGGLE